MQRNREHTLDSYVAKLALRSVLDDREREAVRALPFSMSKQSTGSSFIGPGDKIDCARVVLKGLVASFRQDNDGTRQITALHIRGDIADQPSLMLGESVSGLIALSETTLLHIPLANFREIARTYPAVAAAISRDSAADAAIGLEWAFNVGRKTARARLAHLVCEMATRYEQAGATVGLSFDLTMTQEQLADALAITSVHLNRTLQGLRAENALEMRAGVVQILDWKALRSIAGFDPRYLHFRHVTGQ